MNRVHLAVSLFVTPPAMKQPTDMSPYVRAFAALFRNGCPVHQLFRAVQMPGSQNATSPTMMIWNRHDR
ncbi:MFS general substrate transporter [Colletotrichum asianum]